MPTRVFLLPTLASVTPKVGVVILYAALLLAGLDCDGDACDVESQVRA